MRRYGSSRHEEAGPWGFWDSRGSGVVDIQRSGKRRILL
jgi:hypothetical protein